MVVAALYVAAGGCYFDLPGVDPWDEARDARTYAGDAPVVAHPPCQRWGRYWSGGPMLAGTERAKMKGDDDGCFAKAIAAVRGRGGVLEHPEASHAWLAFGLLAPPRDGGWVPAGDWLGWTCCVEQGHYGHRARKATWLYAVCHPSRLPELQWGPSPSRARLDDGYHSAEARRRAIKTGICQRLSKRERLATPVPFRDVLLSIAIAARSPIHYA